MNNQIINNFMAMARSGGNPNEIAKNMVMNNPEVRQIAEQMKNMANGLSPREFALQYAKQKGVSEADVLKVAKQFGLN